MKKLIFILLSLASLSCEEECIFPQNNGCGKIIAIEPTGTQCLYSTISIVPYAPLQSDTFIQDCNKYQIGDFVCM